MSPLIWKVYRDGEMVASLRYAEEAAAVVALGGAAVIKVNGRIVWREGREAQPAGESYDYVAALCRARRQRQTVVR